ncbi:hypothetical protein ACI2U6_16440 [Ralstonia nicotianae]
MGIKCVKCAGEQVQSIRTVLQAGTTYSTGSVSGVGVGTNGFGAFAGATHSTSQTNLAMRFSPPKKPKKLESIAGVILSLLTSPWLFSKTPLMAISIGFILWTVYEFRKFSRLNKKYQEEYPVWRKFHDEGFLCHTCGTSFIPR